MKCVKMKCLEEPPDSVFLNLIKIILCTVQQFYTCLSKYVRGKRLPLSETTTKQAFKVTQTEI